MKDIFPTKGFNFMRSKGRAVLHSEVLPYFASLFKNGDNIIEIGKHDFWDYRPFFEHPGLLCNFASFDIQEEIKDRVTGEPLKYMKVDITQPITEENVVDGFLFIGMHDNIAFPVQAYKNMWTMLKPGGRLLVAFPGTGATCGGELVADDEWKSFLREYIIDNVWYVYDPENEERFSDGKNTSIIVMARKPYGNH